MCHVIAFFSWQAEDWKHIAQDHADKSLTPGSDNNLIRIGKVAYASLQAAIREKMIIHCEKKWDGIFLELRRMNGTVATAMIEYH